MKRSNALLATLSLSTVLMAGAASFAMASPSMQSDDDSMKSEQPVTDTWITTKVKTELATTEGVKSLDIDVKTVDGVVTLTGTQANDIAVRKAVAAAESVKGVMRVDSSGLKSKE